MTARLLGLGSCLLAVGVHAAGKVVVLPALRQGRVSKQSLQQVQVGLRRAVTARKLMVHDRDVMFRLRSLAPASCRLRPVCAAGAVADGLCLRQACMETIGKLSGARLVLRSQVVATDGGHTLRLWLYSVKRKAYFTAQRSCQRCDAARLSQLAQDGLAALLERQRRGGASGYLSVRSRPQGAGAFVDGVRVGATDLTVGVRPGRHRIALRKPGFVEHRRQVDIEGGVAGAVDVRLRRISHPISMWSPRLWRWILLGIGVAGISSGIALQLVDNDPSCDRDRPQQRCPERYNTKGIGAAFTAVGGASLVGAGMLFYWVYRKDRAEAAAMAGLSPFWAADGGGLSAMAAF